MTIFAAILFLMPAALFPDMTLEPCDYCSPHAKSVTQTRRDLLHSVIYFFLGTSKSWLEVAEIHSIPKVAQIKQRLPVGIINYNPNAIQDMAYEIIYLSALKIKSNWIAYVIQCIGSVHFPLHSTYFKISYQHLLRAFIEAKICYKPHSDLKDCLLLV